MASLQNHAIVNANTDTIVGTWELGNTVADAPSESLLLKDGSVKGESVIGKDGRTRVASADIKPGGKYRCEYIYVVTQCQFN